MSLFVRIGAGMVFWLSAGVIAIPSVGLPNSAHAEVAITGTSNEVRVEASGVALEELLSDLRDKFGISYNSLAPLDHKVVTGTYNGPLINILARLLKDYDHALKMENGHIFLIFTNQQKSTAKLNSAVLAASSTSSNSETPLRLPRMGQAKFPGIGSTTNPTTEKTIPPSGGLPSPGLRAQSPFAITRFLEMQTAPFVSRDSTAASAVPLAQGVSGGTSQAAMAQTMQRANVTLQSLAGSLARLPH